MIILFDAMGGDNAPDANITGAVNSLKNTEADIVLIGKEEVIKNINLIKEKGSRVGIAIKPETPIEKVYEYLPYIHMCLIMTVEPGKGGQTLITDMIAKIDELKTYAEKNSLEIDIEADGGINLKTAERVKNAGANILVAGTAILKAADYKVIIDELKQE